MMAGLQSAWFELGGDIDVVRGMSLAPNHTRHGGDPGVHAWPQGTTQGWKPTLKDPAE